MKVIIIVDCKARGMELHERQEATTEMSMPGRNDTGLHKVPHTVFQASSKTGNAKRPC